MIILLFISNVIGTPRGPRPHLLEPTVEPEDYRDEEITNLFMNITQHLINQKNESERFFDILNYNCHIHEDQMFQVLSTIVTPIKEIRYTLQTSQNCTTILKQYGLIYLCLSAITGGLNIVGMFSVVLIWKNCARYKFPRKSIPYETSPSDESVKLISKNQTAV